MKGITYASKLRSAMRAHNLSIRGLEKRLSDLPNAHSYSYEHIRKITGGLPLMSEKFNDDVCKVLDLNADEMWGLAVGEKNRKRGGTINTTFSIPSDPRLRNAWADLSQTNREKLVIIAEGMAERDRIEREVEQETDPEKLQADIQRRMKRLAEVISMRRETEAPAKSARR